MGVVVGVTDLDGLFKAVYASELINLMPEASRLVKAISFSQDERIGDHFEQPVALTYEHGYTYAAPGSGAFTLRNSIAMKTKKATVDGYQGVLRAQMDYETATKAVSGGARAFKKATQLQVENMMESGTKRVELEILYGQKGIGQVSSSTNTSSTVTVLQLTTASWASGIWAGMENAALNFFTSAGALVSSGTDAVFTINSIDIDNRKLTVTGSATGITALDSAALSPNLDIFFDTARTDSTTFNEFAGLDKIITNTGTLFNISATTYQLWKGNTYSSGTAALTLGKIINAIAAPIGRGGLDEKVTVFMNDRTWANVASDQAALRRYDADYADGEANNGFKYIRFYSQNGEVELQPYNCVKEGEAYVLPLKRLKRIGTCDITFDSPGREGKFFRELTDTAGFEYRLYNDQALFCESPAKLVKITNIVNS